MSKEKIKKYLTITISFILVICFIIIMFNVLNGSINSFDNSIYKYISANIISKSLTPVIKLITHLGSMVFLIVLSVILVLTMKNNKIRINIAYNLVIISIINYVIKQIIKRPRPIGINLIKEGGYSFPSGHSTTSMAFYGLLIYLIYKYVNNKIFKTILIVLLSLIILLIGTSRIYLGVHYASDVLAGFVLGLLFLLVFIPTAFANKKI